VAKDMVAVRIGPDTRMAVVGAPSYFASRSRPQTPEDLTSHDCINLRMQSGGLLPWEFEKGSREVRVKVDGRLVFNTSLMALEAAVAGHGLAYLLEDRVRECLADGRLVRVLADWCRRSQDITFTIQAAGSPPLHSPCSSMRCGTAVELEAPSSVRAIMCVPS
jgi:DNA-binding transcriptional LysR family regulator